MAVCLAVDALLGLALPAECGSQALLVPVRSAGKDAVVGGVHVSFRPRGTQ